jgi:hypothetical protein
MQQYTKNSLIVLVGNDIYVLCESSPFLTVYHHHVDRLHP